MNKEQIIDEAYENYKSTTLESDMKKSAWELTVQSMSGKKFIISKEEFINRCKTDDALSIKWREEYRDFRYGSKEEIEHLSKHYKTDPEFSEKWGLKIEERELSLEERAKWLQDNKGYDVLVGNLEHDHIREVVEEESPTKLITLTYNNETIESYE